VVATQRDAADVVVPIAGSPDAVRATLARMRALALRPGDTLTIVDNRGVGVEAAEVLVAADVRTSYFARNAGAARGHAPWIVFLDADVAPSADLLDRLLAPAPGDDVGVLAGGIVDEPPSEGAGAAVRYAAIKASLSDETTRVGRGEWAFAQTANAAVRRSAFDALGGFREGVRSGGDADLCFRARAAGWRLEARPGAAVVHRSRTSVRALLANRFRHGSGAGWLQREHPGSMPARRWPGLALWALRRSGTGLAAAARGDRDAAIEGLLDGPAVWAFELGRLVPNRPLRQRR
jgi:GT2 family glycosyltransferase